jgi:L-fucono-1,5-lactonase
MRIDSHVHFWRYDRAEYAWIDGSMTALQRDFRPPDAEREMAAARVDACVAVQARQAIDETAALLALSDAHPFIVGVVGWVDLRSDAVDAQLDQFARHPKLVGIRHIAQTEPDERFLLRPDFLRGMARLAERGLPYDILIYSRHLPVAVELVSMFDRQRFVLDHLAKPPIRQHTIDVWERNLRQLAAHPNVMCKLSGLVTEADWRSWTPAALRPYLDVAFDCFGWDRLMIGSDWPVCTLAADYARTMAVVTDYIADRPAHERDAVLGGNALRFWKLTTPAVSADRS